MNDATYAANRGEGVQIPEKIAYVLYVWPQAIYDVPQLKYIKHCYISVKILYKHILYKLKWWMFIVIYVVNRATSIESRVFLQEFISTLPCFLVRTW